MSIKHRHPTTLALSAALATTLITSGCSSIGNALTGDKVDYRTSGSQTVKLDVPPDLSQLPGQTKYGVQSSGSISASSLGRDAGQAAVATDLVAPQTSGAVKLERQGQTRWLSVALPPEKIWDDVRQFWLDSGFELAVDKRDIGVMETTWAENRTKVGQDGVRGLISKVFESLYDSGERDSYRIRIERTATGSEIYVSHRGLEEVYEDAKKERTTWRARPSDAGLEAEMLSRLMARLGAPKDAVAAAKADKAPAAAGTAAALPGIAHLGSNATSLTVDTDFDTAWRRVGLALDRSGFTVENRDRKQAFYEVRLSDTDPEASKPGFFARLFGSAPAATDGLSRYRVVLSGQSRNSTQINVLDDKGQASGSATAKRITKQLVDELN
ncbi:outer membrane protein assembly factor BamC [Aquabacterium sp.]|jgi:outer membrane protein assembly factor BamC|uniref:outer membrane protein assembly factor BamC n=1 Tax=Aquabacterium sp. TaxID=1872578 RepID=UPI0025B96F5E|nr:outer membrane protein assembly factor BamC [Aquabacterium sp.]